MIQLQVAVGQPIDVLLRKEQCHRSPDLAAVAIQLHTVKAVFCAHQVALTGKIAHRGPKRIGVIGIGKNTMYVTHAGQFASHIPAF